MTVPFTPTPNQTRRDATEEMTEDNRGKDQRRRTRIRSFTIVSAITS